MDAVIRKQLKIKACKARMGIIGGVFNAKSGHPGGSLSCVDIVTYLYFQHNHYCNFSFAVKTTA